MMPSPFRLQGSGRRSVQRVGFVRRWLFPASAVGAAGLLLVVGWLSWQFTSEVGSQSPLAWPQPQPQPALQPPSLHYMDDSPLPAGFVRRDAEVWLAEDPAHVLQRLAADLDVLSRTLDRTSSVSGGDQHTGDTGTLAHSSDQFQSLIDRLSLLQSQTSFRLRNKAEAKEEQQRDAAAPPEILVGIMSARDHFELREAQRQTWLTWPKDHESERNRMKHVFVLGELDCEIPLPDRRSPYECSSRSEEPPRFDMPLSAVGLTKTKAGHQRVPPPPIVGYDVVFETWTALTHLGVYDSGADGWTTDVRVKLWDRGNEKAPILEALFTPSRPGVLRHGFRYLETAEVTLPRGFGALITVEGLSGQDYFIRDANSVHYQDGGGIISFGDQLKYALMSHTFPSVAFPSSLREYAALSFLYNASSRVPGTTYSIPWRSGVSYADTQQLACDTLRLTSQNQPTRLIQLTDRDSFDSCTITSESILKNWTVHSSPAGAAGQAFYLDLHISEVGLYYFAHPHSCSAGMRFVLNITSVPNLLEESRQLQEGRANRRRMHRQYLENVKRKVAKEMETYNDVILLPQFVDTYRQLPAKVLGWLQYAVTMGSPLLLKTDDDVFLDMERIFASVDRYELQRANRTWWGAFRINWPVDRLGKWKETEYLGNTYPPFACGSGHIMTRDLARAVTRQSQSIHSFQGEDVSLGLWLAPLAPQYLKDTQWQCFGVDRGCMSPLISSPEHSPDSLREMWKAWQDCRNPCGC